MIFWISTGSSAVFVRTALLVKTPSKTELKGILAAVEEAAETGKLEALIPFAEKILTK